MGQVSGDKLLIILKSNSTGSLDDKPMTTRRVTLTMQNTTTVPSRHLPSRTLGALALFVTVLGAVMYVVEGPATGFTSIPRSIYWAIVTITTVGYGDISPATPIGQTIAGIAILIGYSVLAVTTGVITAELTNEIRNNRQTIMCPHCERSGHEGDADYCKYCGGGLHEDPEDEDVEDEEQAKARDKLD